MGGPRTQRQPAFTAAVSQILAWCQSLLPAALAPASPRSYQTHLLWLDYLPIIWLLLRVQGTQFWEHGPDMEILANTVPANPRELLLKLTLETISVFARRLFSFNGKKKSFRSYALSLS